MWNIIGQYKAVSLLQRSIGQGKLAHGYLFTGPPGVGKMRLAILVARALNCDGEEPPCERCEPCMKIAAGKHADVQVIGVGGNGAAGESKAATEISIDQIRQIQHAASLPPFEGKYRVYIIDGAEQMSTEASNCLLKTLEEPMDNVVFILLTTNEKLLLDTVISRCQRVELSPLHRDAIERALVEKYAVEESSAALLSRLSRGAVGWAIDALNNEKVLQQREERLRTIIEILYAGIEQRFTYVAEMASQFSRDRASVFELLSMWEEFFHDVLKIKTDIQTEMVNIDIIEVITGAAHALNLAQIRDALHAVREAGVRLRLNANAQLTLEVFMLNIPHPERTGQVHA